MKLIEFLVSLPNSINFHWQRFSHVLPIFLLFAHIYEYFNNARTNISTIGARKASTFQSNLWQFASLAICKFLLPTAQPDDLMVAACASQVRDKKLESFRW